MLANNSGNTADKVLEEFHLLLRDCCLDHTLPRTVAVRYQICRSALMAGALKAQLPGFVRQCVSLLKFREFIHLYDHDPAARVEFIDRSLDTCWAELGQERPRADGPVIQSEVAPVPAVASPTPSFHSAESEHDDFMRDEEEDSDF